MKIGICFSVLLLGISFQATASEIRYSGAFVYKASSPHTGGVNCQVQVSYEGDKLTQVHVVTDKPVFGKTDFPSKEQEGLYSANVQGAYLALIYKLVGPTHSWYYVYVGFSADTKSFSGDLFKAPGKMEDIKSVLTSGNPIPANWVKEGLGTLNLVAISQGG